MRKVVARKIFPEDYAFLRRLVFLKNKTYIEILEDIHIEAIHKIESYGLEYYLDYESHKSSYLLHKTISLPVEFNDFLMKYSLKGFPAKHLLSAIIQDYKKQTSS